jgi:hypothetical protein
MPQDQTQLDPNYDYAQLKDGSYAQFKKGTSPEEMRSKLVAKGLLATPTTAVAAPKPQAAPVTPTAKPPSPLKRAGERYAETMMIPTSKEGLKQSLIGASGAGYAYQTGKGVYEGFRRAAADVKSHQLVKAATDILAPLAPFPSMIGRNVGEDIVNKSYAGLAGTGAGLATQAILLGRNTDPEVLRQRAAELDTKALKTADASARDYKLSSGLQVAQENIIGTARALPGKIEQVRSAKNAEVVQRAKTLDSQGTTVDLEQDIRPITRDAMQILNTRGLLTDTVRKQVTSLLERLTTQTDMRTGQKIPRPLAQTTVTQALELSKGLEDLSAFGKEAPPAISNLARRLRGAINDRVGQAAPDIQRLRAEESRLITAREAARENFAKILNDKSNVGRGVIYSGTGTIGLYLGIKALGVMPMAAIGSVVILTALAKSTLSRTLRAALYARAADMFEGAVRANAAPSGPNAGGLPGSGTTGPPRPQVPPQQALTGAKPQIAAPVAEASVVSTNPPSAGGTVTPSGRSLTPTELQVQAQPGSRGMSPDITKWQPPPELGVSNVGDIEKRIAANRAKMGEPPRSGKTNVAESNTRTKAMMDRLDNLYERQAKPKSGADRNAIEREIGEIKRVLSGEVSTAKGTHTTRSEASTIDNRIKTRERLASQRAEAVAQSGATGQATGAGEPISRSASPELRAVALDAGYKALAKYEGGSEMVKALRQTAKAMQRVDPSYDEVEKLTEALQVLKQIGDQGQ